MAKEKPKFKDLSELTEEQFTDPDYRLKRTARDAGISEEQIVQCSRCHHCRR